MIKKNFLKNLYLYYFVQSSNRVKKNIHYDSKFKLSSYFLLKTTPKKNQNRFNYMCYKFSEIQLITIDLASPEKIKEWAEKKLPNGKIFGQVTNPNTLHYKTLKPLKGGLFCERIFGPIKDFECACGIHKQKPFNRIISFQNKQFCPKCDVEYTWSDIRRYQLGYIELVTPITHLWYLKGMPSYIRSVLGAKKKHIEAIAYCSEIVTIDKAWKPNRFIPFPETISSVAISSQIKKTIIDHNEIKNFEHIQLYRFKKYNSTTRKMKYINERFVQKRFSNTMLNLEHNEIPNSIFFFKYFNINFRRHTYNLNWGSEFLDINPYFYTIENSSYKSQIDFYQRICRSFIKTSLKNNKPIYALNLLYRSFSNSKVSFKIFNNFYNTNSIVCVSFFNEELLNNRFNNLYIFKKYKKNKQRFRFIHSKKIHININKNLLYFNNKRLKNLQLLNNSTLLTKISKNISLNYLKNYSKKYSLKFKIKLLNKKLNLQNSNIFFNNFISLYFNIFSLHYFKNSNFFVNFEKFLTINSLKFMKYNFFNIFIIPIPMIIDNFILKLSLDSKFNILFNSITIQKQKLLNSDSIIIKSNKTLKKQFFINNLSVYEEASEIVWQKFWKVCYFFTYNKINQKLCKIMKKNNQNSRLIRRNLPLSLKQIKKIITKIKIDKKNNQNLNNFEVNTNLICMCTNNKFSLFVNLIKIYLKKIIFIYQIAPEKIESIDKSIFILQKFLFFNKNGKSINFRNKIKTIVIKLFSLELLPWILSNFISTSRHFYKYKNFKFNFNEKSDYLKLNETKWNLIKRIQKSSFFNFQMVNSFKGMCPIFNNKYSFNCLRPCYIPNDKLKKIFFIYKNKIENILKFKKFRLFCNIWFSQFLKKYHGVRNVIVNSKLNNINSQNLQSLNLLFYQKKWLLKKKQVFYNYALLKQFNSNLVIETSNYLNFSKFIKLIYSSMYKNEIFINLFSIQIKKFYKLNTNSIVCVQKYFNSAYYNYSKFYLTKHPSQTLFNYNSENMFLKKFNYVYSFILFPPKMSNKFFISLTYLNNEQFFLNLFYFLKFAKKNLFNKLSFFKKIQKYFYSLLLFKYRKKQQQKSILQFVQKKIFFYRFLYLIPSFMSYYKKKCDRYNCMSSIIKLILKKKILIFYFLKKFQIKLISEIQKYYFYEFEKKKYFQIEFNVNYFKNIVIFMDLKKKILFFNSILFQPKTIFFHKYKFDIFNSLNNNFIYRWFKEFFFISQFWQIIINIFKNRIQKSSILSISLPVKFYNDSVKIESLKKNLNEDLKDQLSFNSFLIKLIFSNFSLSHPLLKIIKNTKNKILQTRQQYSKLLKSNNLIIINYFKKIWNQYNCMSSIKNNQFENNFLFFIYYSSYQWTPDYQSIQLKKNNYLLNFYLKFIKHDLNKNFNEAIFSVISESRTNFNESIFWNNMYSLSNRYSWKSDIELNIFLCYMLSPENPSDILIPLYKQRIHSSNVLREEPPIAGGGIILKFLKELDLPEMKKIDIQLQTILKKIPNKLHEIEVLLKHYQTNLKFLKYYSLKRRTLIEIEKSILRKLKYIRRLNWVSAKPQYMIIRNLPVLPADLRPIFKIQQQLTASDLNRLYQKVMYRNDRLKRFLKNATTSNSFEMLFAQRMLQEAVDNLIENGKDINSIEMDSRGRPLKSLGELLKGKKGRFRQNLLGKRVDYSGRSVIVVGPKLKLHECGLPIEMAIELFLPFLIKEILKKKYALTVRSAKVYIKKHRIKITQLLRQVVKRQPILLNRAPTLHRLGIQAFLPKLVEGKAILLHPLVCSAFNADFDGDQMAVHVPITNEARIEAWKLILSRNNLLSPATGEPILLPSQDMVLGCYYLTIENVQSFIQKQHWKNRIIKNQTNYIFNNFENIFLAYQRNQINLHTNIWAHTLKGISIESDSVLQEPTEIQVQFSGQYTKIYSDYYQKFKRNGEMYNQVIRTTPGRILFNLMLNNCFN
uniref:DNA-directed RNA polymerase subunit beta' n=1 Tax=Oedocladium prescottii TaxID=337949 RepID=A0A8K1MXA8_9CHLO|nr:RNA polymerase beta' subunit [Oedocladium prescottii]